jgi:hypothetical protein
VANQRAGLRWNFEIGTRDLEMRGGSGNMHSPYQKPEGVW